ncbi:ABC transporter permease [Natranaerobius trueperi]|uniref:Diguanylate cyclase n=1 Tax=Natranaerobius trueperi TaxID=759412 RepID=A0A226BZE0_9FIRM|nr:ABC transporter permease [Natranaerobius trueperi]OWZ83694.1 diguanylate cyclase [Natranaerobius trueperi]
MSTHNIEKDQLTKNEFQFLEQTQCLSESISRPSTTYWQDAWRRLKKNKVAIVALCILSFIIIMCLIGPYLTPYEYNIGEVSNNNEPPSKEHWFGTDSLGRDIFTRVWMGGRVSIGIGIIGAIIDIIIGLTYGGISAYFGGKVDNIMMRIVETLVSIPYLVVVVLVSLIIGQGLLSLIIAMTITGWCHMARLVRGQVLQIKQQEYILAARALGTSPVRIIAQHLIPNTIGVMVVAATFDIPSFIFGEAFLSYIGLGVQSPMTSWGAMASSAQQHMMFYPYQLFFPALLISLTMLSFQLLGDGLRDALDPKLRE